MKAQQKTVEHEVDGKTVTYTCLAFMCPGCASDESMGSGLHMLPVNCHTVHQPSWTWNNDVLKPTLSPSILTRTGNESQHVCHSYLIDGKFNFLEDCTHAFKGQSGVPMPDLPDWIIHETET